MATGRTFSNKQGNATYPRWHEVAFPKKKEELPTGDNIMNELMAGL